MQNHVFENLAHIIWLSWKCPRKIEQPLQIKPTKSATTVKEGEQVVFIVIVMS